MGVRAAPVSYTHLDVYKRQGLYLLPPFGAETMRTEGKISSLASIMRFLKNSHEEYVLLSD